jgi:hypothetical protein
MQRLDGGKALGIIPLGEGSPAWLKRWQSANDELHRITRDMLDAPRQWTDQQLLDHLMRSRPAFEGDPFLESCFWQKFLESFNREGNKELALNALREALAKGYPGSYFLELARTLGHPVE